MKEFKGTKGEWVAEPAYNGVEIMILDVDGYQLATSTGIYKGGPELAKANAKLIAAAPDLLSALQFVLKEVNDPTISRVYIKNVCKKAISKALD